MLNVTCHQETQTKARGRLPHSLARPHEEMGSLSTAVGVRACLSRRGEQETTRTSLGSSSAVCRQVKRAPPTPRSTATPRSVGK